ncbi:MAG: DUF547 domain-containing protein [Stagnimonas sp.]|nr:DUF547 domain-containing protein [Stagnimonas sp.]
MRFASLLLLFLVTCGVHAAPKADLWPRWQAHDDANAERIGHEEWDRLLAQYVKVGADGINRVAYSRISVADKAALAAYLQRLQSVPISRYARAEQRPYWINLYNAQTMQLVVDKYPVASIRDIRLGGGLLAQFFGGPWAAKTLKVEGTQVALDDVEHRILRPIWRDPRIHYAVNCASIGCPNLATQAYTAERTETLLDAGARAYVNHPRGAKVEGGKLVVSSIYVWFMEDFGGNDAGILAHLRQYAAPTKQMALAPFKSLGDNSDRYDWALNDAR